MTRKDIGGIIMSSRSAKNYNMYVVTLKKEGNYSVEMMRDGSDTGREGSRHFVKPDTRKGIPKLYVVKSDSQIVYVGQTTRPIAARLKEGLRERKNGHKSYSYMWKDLPEVSMLIWCFDDRRFDDNGKEYGETIEGELVFLLRSGDKKRKWPRYQMEIHFHDAKTDEVEVAERIFREAVE
jgi:hypothetical protein